MPLTALLALLIPFSPAELTLDSQLDQVDALEADFWANFRAMEAALDETLAAGRDPDPEAAAEARAPAAGRFMALKERSSTLRSAHRERARSLQPSMLQPDTPEAVRGRLRGQELAINRMRSRKEDMVKRFDDEEAAFAARLGEHRRSRRLRRAAAMGAGTIVLLAAAAVLWTHLGRRPRRETLFDPALGRKVDVLRLPGGADDLARARLAASLEHPGILRLHSAQSEGGGLALVFEHCAGTPLADSPKLPWKDLARVARAACAALEHAHARGAAHGSLDGRAILLTEGGGVKLTGFGARPGTVEGDLRDLAACLKAAAGELPPGAASLLSDPHHTAASFAAAIMKV